MLAFAVDVGNWYVHERQLQNRVDDAAFAAALAYGYRFPACTSSATLANEITFTAKKYAGEDTGLPAAFQPPVNTSVNDPDELDVSVNSATLDGPDRFRRATGATWGIRAAPTRASEADFTSPGGGFWVDVKARETDVPSLFGGLGVPVPANHRSCADKGDGDAIGEHACSRLPSRTQPTRPARGRGSATPTARQGCSAGEAAGNNTWTGVGDGHEGRQPRRGSDRTAAAVATLRSASTYAQRGRTWTASRISGQPGASVGPVECTGHQPADTTATTSSARSGRRATFRCRCQNVVFHPGLRSAEIMRSTPTSGPTLRATTSC